MLTLLGFDEATKKQLHELAEIINKFKSEQVQLKVVEYVLGGMQGKTQPVAANPTHAPTANPTHAPSQFIPQGTGQKP